MVIERETLSSGTARATKKIAKVLEAIEDLRVKMLIISVPICICGIIGNIIVLWLIFSRVKKSKFSLYFANVAVANLIIISFDAIIAFLYFTSLRIPLIFSRILTVLHMCGYDTSFYLFTAAAAERCVAIFFPAWYRQHRPSGFSVIMCIALWGVSCSVSLVDYFSCFPRFDINFEELLVSCKTSYVIAIVIEVIIFSPSMMCFTLAIWIRMQRVPETSAARIDITIVAIGILFLIINLPIRMVNIFSFWFPTINYYMLSGISLLLDSINSSISPVIYLIVGCWKRPESLEPVHMFLERAIKEEENNTKKTQANTEQA